MTPTLPGIVEEAALLKDRATGMPIPLGGVSVEAEIVEGSVRTVISQRFTNKGEKPVEAEAALKRSLEIRVKAFGESNDIAQRTIKVLVSLYTDWKKPAQAAAYEARLKPADAKTPAAAPR